MGYLNNNGLSRVWSRMQTYVQDHLPTALKCPNKLKFTGAASAEYDGSSAVTVNIPSGGSVAWGDLTGTLSNQTDLQSALDAKQNNHAPHVLWSGGAYMNASQTINLSENVSAQPHGIVLHFQAYSSSAVQNYRHQYYFVPKTHVANYSGSGLLVPLGIEMSSSDGSVLMTGKYLYISNSSIAGFANNSKSKSTGYVLTQVIGV